MQNSDIVESAIRLSYETALRTNLPQTAYLCTDSGMRTSWIHCQVADGGQPRVGSNVTSIEPIVTSLPPRWFQ